MSKLLTLIGALVLMVGIPAGTLVALGQLQATPAGYLAGIVAGLCLMAALMVVLQRFAEDPFVLEVATLIGLAAGLAFVAYLALR